MIPIFLDPSAARIALIGRGSIAERRYAWLRGAGADPVVWTDAPSGALPAAADTARMPRGEDLRGFHAIWIAGLGRGEATLLAEAARRESTLVNVEDVPAWCDFHTPAVVRRGKLTLAAGTGGASPAVARAARERLEEAFTPQWADALEEVAEARVALRANNAPFEALVGDARERLAHHGLP